jgi:hypothetical protein
MFLGRRATGSRGLATNHARSSAMLRLFVEEAAALTSIALFVGMIAIWAQVIPQL